MKNKIIAYSLLLVIGIHASCGSNDSLSSHESLKLISSYSIDVPEPSGLSFTSGKVALYTVSDQTNSIYKITLQGKLLSTVNCNGSDLEGVCYNDEDKSIWVVEERNRALIKVDLQGNTLKRVELNIQGQVNNSGLEGITLNTGNGHFFCLNEANPGMLIELNENQQVLKETRLSFATDYSGIFYDEVLNKLWIVSDESSTITKCNLLGEAEKTYRIGITSAEGIVVDSKNNLVYIISDSLEKLYVFSL